MPWFVDYNPEKDLHHKTMNPLKQFFLLDPEVHFLNHGSFGATPVPVFDAYQQWQRQLECQPVLFLGRRLDGLLKESRAQLAEYLHTNADNLVYIPNATHGVNIIARSLQLNPGDEILSTDHEYGACNYTWEFICHKSGASYINKTIPLPVHTSEEALEQFWQGVTSHTRVIFLSHITSPTALHLPVEAICTRARQAGILTIIDGAHAPGQIPLNLEAIGADFYTGNCHKWMLSPKGVGFLYARPEVQSLVEPLIVSWGYHPTPQTTSGSQYIDYLQWTGTKDPAACLAVPSAIQFMQDHDWDQVRADCHDLLHTTIQRIGDIFSLPPVIPLESGLYHQMGIAPLPVNVDLVDLKARLYDQFRVEIPLIDWNGQKFARISVQGYNTQADVDALCLGLSASAKDC
jgi:isopenicillin-N epimerase